MRRHYKKLQSFVIKLNRISPGVLGNLNRRITKNPLNGNYILHFSNGYLTLKDAEFKGIDYLGKGNLEEILSRFKAVEIT